MQPETILEIRNLHVEFSDGATQAKTQAKTQTQAKALDGINLQVRTGEILGIVGESGSGK